MKYDFEFTWDSTYGYAARLVGDQADTGLVVDLGCGLGTFSQPLVEIGFDYLGFEFDPESVDECRRRGVACEPIDLHDMDGARERVLAAVGDRRVVAVSLLDVVEHLPDPASVLAGVAALLDALAGDGQPPLLVMSIPNVAHADLAAKLVLGRWDVTETGLLDATHITLFTHERLIDAVETAGLVEVGRNDVVLTDTEQRFPADHPAVAQGTPVHRFLHALRLGADPWGHTYQFVRAYRRGPAAEMTAHVDRTTPRCTVVVPIVGGVGLSATVASLAAQTETDIEVRLVFSPRFADRVTERVGALASAVRDRVHLDEVDAEHRCALLNVGLDRATGDLVMFAEEGDVLPPTLIADVCAAAEQRPGQAVRAAVAAPTPFDLFRHLVRDETPLSSIAIPACAVRTLGLRFVDVGDGFETWDFVARAASTIGLVDCAIEAPANGSGAAEGRDVPLAVATSIDGEQWLLPAGTSSVLRGALVALTERPELESELEIARQRIDALERSRYWRLTAPVRMLTSKRPSLRPRRPRGTP